MLVDRNVLRLRSEIRLSNGSLGLSSMKGSLLLLRGPLEVIPGLGTRGISAGRHLSVKTSLSSILEVCN